MDIESTHQDTTEILQLPKECDDSLTNETTTSSLDDGETTSLETSNGGSSPVNKTKNGAESLKENKTIGLKNSESVIPFVDEGNTNMLSEEKKPQRNEALDPIIEEKQERIDDLLDHFTRFVNKRNFKNYQYVIGLQDQLIKSYQDQLKALIDMPNLDSEEPASVNSNTATKHVHHALPMRLKASTDMPNLSSEKSTSVKSTSVNSNTAAKHVHHALLMKRQICIDFYESATCTKQNCEYLHIRTLEVPRVRNPQKKTEGRRKAKCFDLIANGICRGQACPYGHDLTNVPESRLEKLRRNATKYNNKNKRRKLDEK